MGGGRFDKLILFWGPIWQRADLSMILSGGMANIPLTVLMRMPKHVNCVKGATSFFSLMVSPNSFMSSIRALYYAHEILRTPIPT